MSLLYSCHILVCVVFHYVRISPLLEFVRIWGDANLVVSSSFMPFAYLSNTHTIHF